MAVNPDRVLKPTKKLRKLFKKVPKQFTPEQVHDLRTNTRRLEAVRSALSLDSQRKQKKLFKALARVRKRAGKVRDMDVLTDYASSVRVRGEESCRVQLIEHLGAERRDAAYKLHKAIAKGASRTRIRLRQTLKNLREALCVNGSSDCDSADAPAQATASALKLEFELFDPPRLTRNNLHPYRLKVKKLQNVLRISNSAENQDFVGALTRVKDVIGEWHDWEELLAVANDSLPHRNCGLVRELRRISNKKFDQAIAEAENMRKKYLRAGRNKNGSQSRRPSEAVRTATIALSA